MGQKDESSRLCLWYPDSGVGMALGYAEGKGVPYHRAISKYTPTWPRGFTPSNRGNAFVGCKDEVNSRIVQCFRESVCCSVMIQSYVEHSCVIM